MSRTDLKAIRTDKAHARRHNDSVTLDWMPLVVGPAATLLVKDSVPAWIFTWLMAFAIFAACKWLTWRKACRGNTDAGFHRSLGYLLLWPGVDARAFLYGWQTAGGTMKWC